MNILVSFILAVVVSVLVYIISQAVPFLATYAWLLGIVAFVLTFYYNWQHPVR